jgi:hypothetical protein
MANESTHLTITLTGRPPVKIKKTDWPALAGAADKEHDGQVECQANRAATWKLTVRQHADGRAIIYGVHTYDSHWQGEHGRDVRGGELLDKGGDIAAAIRRVADELEARLPDQGAYGQGVFPRLAHECTADLPAVEL